MSKSKMAPKTRTSITLAQLIIIALIGRTWTVDSHDQVTLNIQEKFRKFYNRGVRVALQNLSTKFPFNNSGHQENPNVDTQDSLHKIIAASIDPSISTQGQEISYTEMREQLISEINTAKASKNKFNISKHHVFILVWEGLLLNLSKIYRRAADLEILNFKSSYLTSSVQISLDLSFLSRYISQIEKFSEFELPVNAMQALKHLADNKVPRNTSVNFDLEGVMAQKFFHVKDELDQLKRVYESERNKLKLEKEQLVEDFHGSNEDVTRLAAAQKENAIKLESANKLIETLVKNQVATENELKEQKDEIDKENNKLQNQGQNWASDSLREDENPKTQANLTALNTLKDQRDMLLTEVQSNLSEDISNRLESLERSNTQILGIYQDQFTESIQNYNQLASATLTKIKSLQTEIGELKESLNKTNEEKIALTNRTNEYASLLAVNNQHYEQIQKNNEQHQLTIKQLETNLDSSKSSHDQFKQDKHLETQRLNQTIYDLTKQLNTAKEQLAAEKEALTNLIQTHEQTIQLNQEEISGLKVLSESQHKEITTKQSENETLIKQITELNEQLEESQKSLKSVEVLYKRLLKSFKLLGTDHTASKNEKETLAANQLTLVNEIEKLYKEAQNKEETEKQLNDQNKELKKVNLNIKNDLKRNQEAYEKDLREKSTEMEELERKAKEMEERLNGQIKELKEKEKNSEGSKTQKSEKEEEVGTARKSDKNEGEENSLGWKIATFSLAGLVLILMITVVWMQLAKRRNEGKGEQKVEYGK